MLLFIFCLDFFPLIFSSIYRALFTFLPTFFISPVCPPSSSFSALFHPFSALLQCSPSPTTLSIQVSVHLQFICFTMAYRIVSEAEYQKKYATMSEEEFNDELESSGIQQMTLSTPSQYSDLLKLCGISDNGFLNRSFYNLSGVTLERNIFFYTLYVKEMTVISNFKRKVEEFDKKKKIKIAFTQQQQSVNTKKLQKQQASLNSLMKKSTKKSTPDQQKQKQKEINELKVTMKNIKEKNELLERELAPLLNDCRRLYDFYSDLKEMENMINEKYLMILPRF